MWLLSRFSPHTPFSLSKILNFGKFCVIISKIFIFFCVNGYVPSCLVTALQLNAYPFSIENQFHL
eukprot:UN01037